MVSGKLYYDLLKAREDQKKDDVALVRLEQLYPFPAAELTARLRPLCPVRGAGVGAGGAAQHGRLALRPRAVPGRRDARLASRVALRRARGEREPGARLAQGARRRSRKAIVAEALRATAETPVAVRQAAPATS